MNYMHNMTHNKSLEIIDSANPNTRPYVKALESGKIIYLPDYHFMLLPHEASLITDKYSHSKTKNISLNTAVAKSTGNITNNITNNIKGLINNTPQEIKK